LIEEDIYKATIDTRGSASFVSEILEDNLAAPGKQQTEDKLE